MGVLERILKVIESHEKEMAKVVANKDVYAAIANGIWKKEDELRTLKGQAMELDRKIALMLASSEERQDEKEGEKQTQDIPQQSVVAKYDMTSSTIQERTSENNVMSCVGIT